MSSQRIIGVSGSSSGIGAATVERLRAGGDRVIGVDRVGTPDITADLATPEGRETALAGLAEASGGRLDGLVTAAGLGSTKDPAEVISTNYFGSIALVEGCRDLLVAAGSAAVVAIGSNSATAMPGIPDEPVAACLDGDEALACSLVSDLYCYGIAKLAITRKIRRMSHTPAWAGAGIRLNIVAPGSTETAILDETRADPDIGPLFEAFPQPLGRNAQPDEIAAVIEFGVSEGSSFMVGSVLFADGGVDAMLRSDDWPVSL